MADNSNGDGMMLGRSSCDWVHARIPLLVDDSDGLACEGNDLNAEDRRFIEHHLTECSSCRQHQAALEKAISVLSIVAAADMAVGLRTPSLWPRKLSGACITGWNASTPRGGLVRGFFE